MRDKLINWFLEKYPYLTQEMKFTKHSYDDSHHSPFHAEDSVWTHTMMVMTVLEVMHIPNYIDRNLLLIAGLLHDIGKTKTLEADHEMFRNKFKGHEGHSAMMSIGILENLKEDFNLLTPEIEIIFKIISLHGINFEDIKSGLYEYLRIFRHADKKGAVRAVDEDIYGQYPKRKFSNVKTSDKKCIIMCGLPNAGKSFYTREFEKEGYTVLSRDNAILEFSGISDYNAAYRFCHSEENLEKFNKFFEKKINTIKKEPKIIIDMTMMSLSSRRKMMNNLGDREYQAYVVLSNLNKIGIRNLERENKFISPNVIHNMCSGFVIPDISEGFERVTILWN